MIIQVHNNVRTGYDYCGSVPMKRQPKTEDPPDSDEYGVTEHFQVKQFSNLFVAGASYTIIIFCVLSRL